MCQSARDAGVVAEASASPHAILPFGCTRLAVAVAFASFAKIGFGGQAQTREAIDWVFRRGPQGAQQHAEFGDTPNGIAC
jgi:hypothetical protein